MIIHSGRKRRWQENTWKASIAKIRTAPIKTAGVIDEEDDAIKRQDCVKLMKEIHELTTKMEAL